MSSISLAPNLLAENLNRCNNIKRDFLDSSSSKLISFKTNLLQEISIKWEQTFNEDHSNDEFLEDSKRNTMIAVQQQTPIHSLNRKSKNRSVYGQPKVENSEVASTMIQTFKSLDSLENFSESVYSFCSTSTSFSDLRTFDNSNKHDSSAFASDLGTSVESSDNEQESSLKRFPSISSECSSSEYSQDESSNKDVKIFMMNFVDKIFANCGVISLEEKAKFGSLARTESGRLWFARYINKKRNNYKCEKESTFYSLAQYFAIVLFECAESDDFTPAKILMNMCFTYYYQPANTQTSYNWSNQRKKFLPQQKNFSDKQYLYSILRDQPIWKLIRFWNAAFFDAVLNERNNFYQNSEHNNEFEDWKFHANVTFGQLSAFTYNIYSFGLPENFCIDFLRKQSVIANLSLEQFKMLQNNIKVMYQESK